MSSTQSAAAPSEPASPPSEPTAGVAEPLMAPAAPTAAPAPTPAAAHAPVVFHRHRTVRLSIIRSPPHPPLPPLEEFGTGDNITPVQIAARLRTAAESARLAYASLRTAINTHQHAYNSALHAYQGNAQPPISDEARRTFSALLRDMQHVLEVLRIHESRSRAVRHQANRLATSLANEL